MDTQGEVFYFSYLYIDGFRTVKDTSISFDQRYTYERSTKSVVMQEPRTILADAFFYGNKVQSLSVLAGRNGTGKSSLIDFLRETFIFLLNDYADIPDRMEQMKKRPLDEELCKRYQINQETEFLIIFSLNGSDYYITNISLAGHGVPDHIQPWNEECKELLGKEWSCAYFSMTRERAGVQREFYIRDDSESSLGVHLVGGMIEKHQIDLSEEKINADTTLIESGSINYDLLLQLVFACEREDYIREEIDKFLIDRLEFRSELITDSDSVRLSEWISSLRKKEDLKMMGLLKDSLAYLYPFSLGQYSRFIFMARLYWCFEGRKSFADKDIYDKLRKVVEAENGRSTLYQGSPDKQPSVLLFDEGDLYYHPEWQRSYVSDIIGMVREFSRYPVQVIFTTNSPFMLSDLLREDIHVLMADNQETGFDSLTFGQNIHMLLANPFFMKKTIGEFSYDVINELFNVLKDTKEPQDGEFSRIIFERFGRYLDNKGIERDNTAKINDFVRQLIENVGESVYRKQLLYYFDKYKNRQKALKPDHQLSETDIITSLRTLVDRKIMETDDAEALIEKLRRNADDKD